MVPRANILKFSKEFYEKLQFYVSYEPPEEFQSTSGESYLIEKMVTSLHDVDGDLARC